MPGMAREIVSMSSENRRKANRVVVSWRGRIGRKGAGVAPFQACNISIGGVFLRTSLELPALVQVLMEIVTEHDGQQRKLLVEGEVLRVVPADIHGLFSYGIRFSKLRDEDLFHLLAVVSELWAAGAVAD